jgi:hypothetical protein
MKKFLGFFSFNWPSCYCRSCGQCTHRARYRFHARFYNSCETCLTCPESKALWDIDAYNSVRSSAHFRMNWRYLFRYRLGSTLTYIAGAWIHPKDADYIEKAKETVGVQ